jgi:hypothetical protein
VTTADCSVGAVNGQPSIGDVMLLAALNAHGVAFEQSLQKRN